MLSRLAAGGMVCTGDSGRGRRSCGPLAAMHLVHAGTTASVQSMPGHSRNAQAPGGFAAGRPREPAQGHLRAGTDVHKPRKSP